ncbi:leukemia inhibitory factor receptor-like [Arapaima gigas]
MTVSTKAAQKQECEVKGVPATCCTPMVIMYFWLLWPLFEVLKAQQPHCLEGIQDLKVTYSDQADHTVFVTWTENCTSPTIPEGLVHEVQVLRTEQNKQNEVVHHETINVNTGQAPGTHHWNWTSPIPLECSTYIVRVRSRFRERTSYWSEQVIPGKNEEQVYPQDEVRVVNSSMTFCCILKENQKFKEFFYGTVSQKAIQISPWIYATTITLNLSLPRGSNVMCDVEGDDIDVGKLGSTVFVGNPPGDNNLTCETDMMSVLCTWNKGPETHLYVDRKTRYTLNGRNCSEKCLESCHCKINEPEAWGERNWTVVARNPLGIVKLIDRVDLRHRIHLQAPQQLLTEAVYARNASIQWKMVVPDNTTLSIKCQVQLNTITQTEQQTYSKQGLSKLMLRNLLPATRYGLKVCCGCQENFWKWSLWSSVLDFTTAEDHPEAVDFWIVKDKNKTSHILWKPLSESQSHGKITEYILTWQSAIKVFEKRFDASYTSYSFDMSDESYSHTVSISITAVNSAGPSPPATIVLPRIQSDNIPTSRIYGDNGRFYLSWPSSPNATCSYIVDWCPVFSGCGLDAGWLKLPVSQTSAWIPSASFAAKVRYRLSIYACHSLIPELLERREGYIVEVKDNTEYVQNLTVLQQGANTVVTWKRSPEETHKGFVLGYIITCETTTDRVTDPINLTNPSATNYSFKNLTPDFYTFTVKAYGLGWTEAGKKFSFDITVLDDYSLILIITGTLFLVLIFMALCYCKRERLKKIFFPEIPKPMLSNAWVTAQTILDVNLCPHSMLQIVDKQEKLENLKEDSGQIERYFPTDTDCSGLPVLRYYKQEPRKELWRHPSSASLVFSPSTTFSSNNPTAVNLTYTRIQTIPSYLPVPFGLDVVPQVDLLPSPSGSDTPLIDTSGTYLPQGTHKQNDADTDDQDISMSISSNQCLLTSYDSQEPLDLSAPSQSVNIEFPASLYTVSNPTYCTTLPSDPPDLCSTTH